MEFVGFSKYYTSIYYCFSIVPCISVVYFNIFYTLFLCIIYPSGVNINRSFRWKFNNSGETLDVGKERHHRNGSTSILQYTPVTDQVNLLYALVE